MAEGSRQTEVRNSMVKVAFGIMALVCLAAGFIVYLFAEQLGFSEDTAQIVAIAFLVAGAGDYLVLKLWDRIMPRR
jgi:positive regulator of sigma E activity